MRKRTLLMVSFFVMMSPCLASNEAKALRYDVSYEKVLKEQPLTTVLRQLEKAFKTQIVFSYDDLVNYKVSCSVKAQTIEEALRQVLKGLPLNFVKRNRKKRFGKIYRFFDGFAVLCRVMPMVAQILTTTKSSGRYIKKRLTMVWLYHIV